MPDSPPSSTCLVLTPRRRGRPPLAEDRKVPLTVWVPPAEADRLIQAARRADVTVSELLRFVVVNLHA